MVKKGAVVDKRSLFGREKTSSLLLCLVLILAAAALIYKADYDGASHDESKSFTRYSKDVYTATHKFNSTNNHILNSIFMHYSQKLFGSYEHCLRIPAVLSGIIYFLSLAYVITKTIKSIGLRVSSLLLLCFLKTVFVYLYTARGYGYALSATVLYIAIVLFFLEHRIRFRYWFVPAIMLSVLNFVAAGCMLSSILALLPLNAVFVLLYAPKIFSDLSGRIKSVIVMSSSILAATGVMIHLLFKAVYKQLFSLEGNYDLVGLTSKWDGWTSLRNYLGTLLVQRIFGSDALVSSIVFYIFISVLSICILWYIYSLAKSIKADRWRLFLQNTQAGHFVISVTFLYIIVLFIYGVVLGRCPGMERNNIVLVPLAIISAVIFLDGFGQSITQVNGRYVFNSIAVILLLIVFVRGRPVLTRAGRMFMSRPVLQKLKTLDPQRQWDIAFSEKLWQFRVGFLYYRMFDYNFNIVSPNDCNVYICRPNEMPKNAICLDWDRTSKSKYAIVLNTKLDPDRIVLEAKLRKPDK